MNIREAKEEIRNTLQAYHQKDGDGRFRYPLVRQRPILLMGPPGIGKTAIMEQIAAECGVGLVSYTMTHHTRQSAIGLPKIVDKTYEGREFCITEYTLSEIIASVYECMERTGKKEGILFIDEINCVSETLAPVMLQFLQNKTFGSHKVPAGWMIVAAGNPPEYNKSVREFDMVTLDRVRRIDVEADCDIWLEYAREHRVHGAVISYLELKKEHFYLVRQSAEDRHFVTARGWEDLSELLKSYEELDVAVTKQQVIQFLQQDEVAGKFTSYYQLYRKYGEDYGITGQLSGRLTEQGLQAAACLAEKAPFDERFTVVSLLLDGLDDAFAAYEELDSRMVLLHRTLTRFKAELQEQEDMSYLTVFIDRQRSLLERKEKLELVMPDEISRERAVLHRLEEYDLTLREKHLLDKKEGFGQIRRSFGQQEAQRRQMIAETEEKLERAFAFVEKCFGNGREMILLVTGLTKSRRAAAFISAHGCDAYFRHSEILMERTPERELQEACRELLG